MTTEEREARDAAWFHWAEALGIYEQVGEPLARELMRRAWNLAWAASREYAARQGAMG